MRRVRPNAAAQERSPPARYWQRQRQRHGDAARDPRGAGLVSKKRAVFYLKNKIMHFC